MWNLWFLFSVPEFSPTHVVRASDKLVDDDQLAELIAAHQVVTIFFSEVTATTV